MRVRVRVRVRVRRTEDPNFLSHPPRNPRLAVGGAGGREVAPDGAPERGVPAAAG